MSDETSPVRPPEPKAPDAAQPTSLYPDPSATGALSEAPNASSVPASSFDPLTPESSVPTDPSVESETVAQPPFHPVDEPFPTTSWAPAAASPAAASPAAVPPVGGQTPYSPPPPYGQTPLHETPQPGAASTASSGGAYAYAYAPWAPPTGAPHPSAAPPPGVHPPATPPKKRWGLKIVALVLAFLLGMGTLATIEQIVGVATGSSPNRSGRYYPVPQEPNAGTQNPGSRNPGGRNPGAVPTPARPRVATSPDVTAEQSKGVVLVSTTLSRGTGSGTGMVLTPGGEVLTNYHVVAGSTAITVTLADTGAKYDASVVGFDDTKDVALLQLAGAGSLPTVTLDSGAVNIGDPLSAVGNAEGGGLLVRADGRVTGLDRDLTVSSGSPWGAQENLSGLIETTAGAVPGDSGGPMFDAENEVAGMTTAGSSDDGESFAIPIADAMEIVTTIRAGQDSGTVRVGPAGYLGIMVSTDDSAGTGRLITDVVADGPAAKAGLVKGSTMTSVNGHRIRSDTNLASVIRILEPGQQVEIAWITPTGERKSAVVTVAASPMN